MNVRQRDFTTPEFVTLSQVLRGAQIYENLPIVIDEPVRTRIWQALAIQMFFLAATILIPYPFFQWGIAPEGFFSWRIGLDLVNSVLHLAYNVLPLLQILALAGLFGTLFLITISKGMTEPVSEFQHYLAVVYIFQAGVSLLVSVIVGGLVVGLVIAYAILWIIAIIVGFVVLLAALASR